MSSTNPITWPAHAPSALAGLMRALLHPLHALIATPSLVFLAALTAMLFRPSDLKFYEIDRVAFVLLVAVVLSRILLLHEPIQLSSTVTLPMFCLLVLAGFELLRLPYDPEAWSVYAAKWLVPLVLFVLAGYVFNDAASLRRLELFALVMLAYLSLTAIAFMLGAKQLIFPPYILDESLGIHADRARGPFLQAVANGVSLNLLALIAVDSFRRRRLRGLMAMLFLIATPLAALATKTRAVWLSFALSVAGLIFFYPCSRVRRACAGLMLAGAVGLLGAICACGLGDFGQRLEERSPVEFRAAMYEAGWGMFLEKPLWGWSRPDIQSELMRRISDFHQEAFYFHNTCLEIAVEYGVPGLALYLWVIADLFKVGRSSGHFALSVGGDFLDRQFRYIWPVMVFVYVLNGMFVVMNYQFVNGFLFTIAGALAAQNQDMPSSHRGSWELAESGKPGVP